MGWNGTYLGYSPSSQEKKELILEELNHETNDRKWEVTKLMQKGSKFYALYTITDVKTGKEDVIILTALTSTDNGDFMTKIVGSDYDSEVPLNWVEKSTDTHVDKEKWTAIIKEANRKKNIVNKPVNGATLTVKDKMDGEVSELYYSTAHKKWIIKNTATYIPKSRLVNLYEF